MSRGLFLGTVLSLTLSGWGCENKGDATTVGTDATEVTKLGKALAGAEAVTVEDLLGDPLAFEGKIVRISGLVKDWCHHRRAWFGLAGKDGRAMVRVFALPRFQAPTDCLGRRAVAEGKVEVIIISAEQAQHYAKDHSFLAGVEVKPGEPVRRPIIRAFGAEFH